MAGLLFGVETEYAIARAGGGGTDRSREPPAGALMRAARQRLVHLPDGSGSNGLFLENGSRLYLDCGLHPEIGTAECTDPWKAVQHLEAGHQIMADLVSAVGADNPGAEITCFRSNVDLSGAETTWACHESYSYRNFRRDLQAELIPHLVTRVIYAGAGGFNSLAGGLAFSLSPRMAFFRTLASSNSTHLRGIWHEKSEPLCKGQGRLHIICGDSLSSQKANVLKIGGTALVAAMADAGLQPGAAVQLHDPVEALHEIAADVTCRRKLRMVSGEERSAVEIQRHYLQLAEEHLREAYMPEWAPAVCALWREVLELMDGAPDSVAEILDWGIKYALYAAHANQQGISWEALPIINQAIEEMHIRTPNGDGEPAGSGPRKAGRKPRQADRRAAESFLAAHNLHLQQMDAVLHARPQFFELETRFSQVGGTKGIFEALNSSGALNHKVDRIGSVGEAMTEPPAGSRAVLRGQVIRRLAGGRAEATWDRIVDLKENRMLDLSDPFATEEVWRPMEPRDREPRTRSLYSQREEALARYLSGDYSGAEEMLRACLSENFEQRSTHCHLARVLLMTDRDAEAREEIQRAWQVAEPSMVYVLARLSFFEYLFATMGDGAVSTHLSRLKGMLGRHAHMDWTIQPMLEHLRPRLGEERYGFLSALAGAISDQTCLEQLEAFPQWRETEPESSWVRQYRENIVITNFEDDGSDTITEDDVPF
jgi:Pup-ligase protein